MIEAMTTLRWSSRKFWTMMFWETVITLLLYLDKIPATVYETLTIFMVCSYLAANVAQHWVEKR